MAEHSTNKFSWLLLFALLAAVFTRHSILWSSPIVIVETAIGLSAQALQKT